MMRIFFLTPFYFDLHKPIAVELERQGYEVHIEEDVRLTGTLRCKNSPLIKRIALHLYRWMTKNVQNYWIRKIETDSSFIERFDYLLCINGESFHPVLLKQLKKTNPQIKTVLYIWDSGKLFDFYNYKNYFDKVFTFDSQDSESYKGVIFLPSYWCPSEDKPIKYYLSIIGSDHDDRLKIVSNIYDQLEKEGIKSYLKVVLRKPAVPTGWKHFFRYYNKRYLRWRREYEEKNKLPYTTTSSFSPYQVIDIIEESSCILDTDIPAQSGVSQRVIWALSKGKKVITTNIDIIKAPFYRSDQIAIINRDNPVIDIEFVKSVSKFEISPYIQDLRIDKWVDKILE